MRCAGSRPCKTCRYGTTCRVREHEDRVRRNARHVAFAVRLVRETAFGPKDSGSGYVYNRDWWRFLAYQRAARRWLKVLERTQS